MIMDGSVGEYWVTSIYYLDWPAAHAGALAGIWTAV